MKTKGNCETRKAAAAFKCGLIVFPGLFRSFFLWGKCLIKTRSSEAEITEERNKYIHGRALKTSGTSNEK